MGNAGEGGFGARAVARTRREPRARGLSRTDLSARLSAIVEELVANGVPLVQARDEFERQFLMAALRRHGGSLGRAAEALGIHRNTLRNKVTSLKVSPHGRATRSRAGR